MSEQRHALPGAERQRRHRHSGAAQVFGEKAVYDAGSEMNALGPVGIHHPHMPLTPKRLWHASHGARQDQ